MRTGIHSNTAAVLLILAAVPGVAPTSMAAVPGAADPHLADRVILRKLLTDIEAGINSGEISRLAPYLDDKVVITHQNAHVARGKQEVISYNQAMTKGPDAPIRKLTTSAAIGGPAYFHGDDLAIAYGTAVDRIELKTGQEFSLDVAWSAALVKKNEQWKAAAIHFSTNLLDNAVLRQTRRMIGWGAAGGTLLGLAIGWFIGRRRPVRAN